MFDDRWGQSVTNLKIDTIRMIEASRRTNGRMDGCQVMEIYHMNLGPGELTNKIKLYIQVNLKFFVFQHQLVSIPGHNLSESMHLYWNLVLQSSSEKTHQ